MQLKRLAITVKGRVQGVGFRYFTEMQARIYEITGWVCNTVDGGVEIEAQGEVSKLELFLEMVGEGPALSQVTDIQFKDIPVLETERNFDIRYCS